MPAFPRMPRIFAGPTVLDVGYFAIVSSDERQARAALKAYGADFGFEQLATVATVPLYVAMR